MQVDNYTSQSFRTKSSLLGLTTNQINFLTQTQSPFLIHKQISSEKLDHDKSKNALLTKPLQQGSSTIKFHPDFSQINRQKNQYSSQPASQSLNQISYTHKNSLELVGLLGKISSVERPTKDQSALYEFPQSVDDKPLEYSLMKFENQSLKTEKKKLEEKVSRLRKEMEEKVSTLTKFNQLMKIKYNEIKELKTSLNQKEQIIQTLEKKTENSINLNEAQRLKQLLVLKSKELDQINAKINNLEHQNFKNQVFQMKVNKLYDELEQEKSKANVYLLQNSMLSQKIKQLQEQIVFLKFQKQKNIAVWKVAEIQQIENLFKNPESSQVKSSKQLPSQSTHLNAFEEGLRVQMKQIQQLKQVIDNSSDVVQKLRDSLITSRRELQELRGEMKILDLKASSERKKMIMEYRLQIHEKDNEINTILKKYKTLEDKYKNALFEIKGKDDFFKQYLVGRTNQVPVQELIDATLKEYTENFDSIISLKTENLNLKASLEKYRMYEEEINGSLSG